MESRVWPDRVFPNIVPERFPRLPLRRSGRAVSILAPAGTAAAPTIDKKRVDRMKKQGIATAFMAVITLTLSACATNDTSLIQTVPVGSGTSKLTVLPFTACVKEKWRKRPLKVGEFSFNADGDVLTVHGTTQRTLVLLDAEPSALGTGYTIYGDVVAASSYVADAHTSD
jgi:hypothetical protein